MCGKTFESFKRAKYCSDNCRNVAVKINKLRYQAKVIEKRPTQKTASDIQHEMDLLQQQAIQQPLQYATKKIFTQPTTIPVDVGTTSIDYITRSINACKELDTARNKLRDIIDVLKIEQAKYNKEDFEFAHAVEGSGGLNDMQKLKLFNDYQVMRSKRRNVKDVIKTLINCIRYTPISTETILKDAISNKIKVDDFFKDFYKQRNGGGN
jgi:hypothetical protein